MSANGTNNKTLFMHVRAMVITDTYCAVRVEKITREKLVVLYTKKEEECFVRPWSFNFIPYDIIFMKLTLVIIFL